MFCYCAASRRIARALTTRYDAALAPCGLTAAQFETLSVLNALKTTTGRILAERLAVDKTTVSRNLQGMLAAKLILVKQDRTDARQQQYSLAAEGRRKLAKAMPLWRRVHQETQLLVGPAAHEALHNIVSALS